MPTRRIGMNVIEEVLPMQQECGCYLTEALSKRHPAGASVPSLQLFTINRNGVHVRRNTRYSADRIRGV